MQNGGGKNGKSDTADPTGADDPHSEERTRDNQGKRQSNPASASKGWTTLTSLVGRLFGNRAETKPTDQTNSDPVPADKIPTWQAREQEYLIDVLERWGRTAEYRIVVEDRQNWQFDVPFTFEGTFRQALREVVKGFGSGPQAPLVVVYANRVIRVATAR